MELPSQHTTHTQHTRADGIKERIHRFLTMDQHRLVVCSILEVGQRAVDCHSIPTMAAPRLLNSTRTRVQVLAWRCHRRAQGALQTTAQFTSLRAAVRESTAAIQQSELSRAKVQFDLARVSVQKCGACATG